MQSYRTPLFHLNIILGVIHIKHNRYMTYLYLYMYLCVSISMNIYIYIHTYLIISVYIYIYIIWIWTQKPLHFCRCNKICDSLWDLDSGFPRYSAAPWSSTPTAAWSLVIQLVDAIYWGIPILGNPYIAICRPMKLRNLLNWATLFWPERPNRGGRRRRALWCGKDPTLGRQELESNMGSRFVYIIYHM